MTVPHSSWSKWLPLKFAHPHESNPNFPNVYLTTDPSDPNSLIVTPEFDFPFPFHPPPFSPNDPPNETLDHQNLVDTSQRRPNKLRKPRPSSSNISPSPTFPPLLQVLNSAETSADPLQVHSDSNPDPLSPSPTPSAATSHAPLLHPGAHKPVSPSARKLTKRRRSKSSYVRLLGNQPNVASTSPSPPAERSASSHSLPSPQLMSMDDNSYDPMAQAWLDSDRPDLRSRFSSPSEESNQLTQFPRKRRDSAPNQTLHNKRTKSKLTRSRGPRAGRRSASESRYRRDEGEFLPPVRAASPFRVNMPTYQKWHERRATFHASSTPLPSDYDNHEPLASFAWTGITPSGNRNTWRSTWNIGEQYYNVTNENPGPAHASAEDLLSTRLSSSSAQTSSTEFPIRPRVVKKGAEVGVRQRWTLPMAITDENITDEALVEELERLRREVVPSTFPRNEKGKMNEDNQNVYGEPHADPQQIPTSTIPDMAIWQTARRAILTCREIVRTEQYYLTRLRRLLNDDVDGSVPPTLMLSRILALVDASEKLLVRMTEDPSAWGVAAAFVGSGDELEDAFVQWCGVVGEFFVERAGDDDQVIPGQSADDSDDVVRPRGKSFSSAGALMRSRSKPGILTRKRTSATECSKEMDWQKNPSVVRDIAILPTQRVTRYVLLYRALLEHTPSSSPSRAIVECAVEVALRIAQKCDRAQDNMEFGPPLQRSGTSLSHIDLQL